MSLTDNTLKRLYESCRDPGISDAGFRHAAGPILGLLLMARREAKRVDRDLAAAVDREERRRKAPRPADCCPLCASYREPGVGRN